MKRDSIQDSTRYVVSGVHRGGVIPGTRAEMWKDVFIESGSRVEGAIWGNELNIMGPDVHVSDAVYCRGAIKVNDQKEKTKGGELVNFASSVVSPDSIVVEGKSFKTRFNTDVYGGIINLSNCFVYGNIYATNAIIKNCVVLGGIYCKKKLELRNSIVFTFDASDTLINENLSMLAPFALSKNSLVLNGKARAISFYDILKGDGDGVEGFIELNEDDIFRLKTSSIAQEDQEIEYTNVLSFSERLLNSDDIMESFKKNRKIVEDFTLQSHLNTDDKKIFEEQIRSNAENNFGRMIEEGLESRELSGSKPYQDLLERIEG